MLLQVGGPKLAPSNHEGRFALASASDAVAKAAITVAAIEHDDLLLALLHFLLFLDHRAVEAEVAIAATHGRGGYLVGLMMELRDRFLGVMAVLSGP